MQPQRARVRKVSAEFCHEDLSNALESPSHTSGTALPSADSAAHRARNASAAAYGTRGTKCARQRYKCCPRKRNADLHPTRFAALRAEFPAAFAAYPAI